MTDKDLKKLLGNHVKQELLYNMNILTVENLNRMYELRFSEYRTMSINSSNISYVGSINSSLEPTSELALYWNKLEKTLNFDAMKTIFEFINKNEDKSGDTFDEYTDEEFYEKWKIDYYDKFDVYTKQYLSNPKEYFFSKIMELKKTAISSNGQLTSYMFLHIACFFL